MKKCLLIIFLPQVIDFLLCKVPSRVSSLEITDLRESVGIQVLYPKPAKAKLPVSEWEL